MIAGCVLILSVVSSFVSFMVPGTHPWWAGLNGVMAVYSTNVLLRGESGLRFIGGILFYVLVVTLLALVAINARGLL